MQESTGKVKVLFLCTGNSCRSQMAEGWARHLRNDVVEAHSAGTNPHGLDARAVAVMAEAGVDISNQYTKHVDELGDIEFDYVVTLCGHADENCPVFIGKTKKVHENFEDPPKLAEGANSEEEAVTFFKNAKNSGLLNILRTKHREMIR